MKLIVFTRLVRTPIARATPARPPEAELQFP